MFQNKYPTIVIAHVAYHSHILCRRSSTRRWAILLSPCQSKSLILQIGEKICLLTLLLEPSVSTSMFSLPLTSIILDIGSSREFSRLGVGKSLSATGRGVSNGGWEVRLDSNAEDESLDGLVPSSVVAEYPVYKASFWISQLQGLYANYASARTSLLSNQHLGFEFLGNLTFSNSYGRLPYIQRPTNTTDTTTPSLFVAFSLLATYNFLHLIRSFTYKLRKLRSSEPVHLLAQPPYMQTLKI